MENAFKFYEKHGFVYNSDFYVMEDVRHKEMEYYFDN